MRRTSLLRTGTSTFAVENFCFGQKIKYPSPNSLRKLVRSGAFLWTVDLDQLL